MSSENKNHRTINEKPSILFSFEKGNEEQREFEQQVLQHYNSPVLIDYSLSDTMNKYYIELRDMGRNYKIQDGGFVNTENMMNNILQQIYSILFQEIFP